MSTYGPSRHGSGSYRPRVLAHRGASDVLAEHTLSAYLRAIDDGADGLECDVRLTADGHLVCVHDRTVQRTSSGRGHVSTLELADLNDLDWVSWKQPWSDLDDEAPDVTDSGVLEPCRIRTVVDCISKILSAAALPSMPAWRWTPSSRSGL